jgi:hypothetical protein
MPVLPRRSSQLPVPPRHHRMRLEWRLPTAKTKNTTSSQMFGRQWGRVADHCCRAIDGDSLPRHCGTPSFRFASRGDRGMTPSPSCRCGSESSAIGLFPGSGEHHETQVVMYLLPYTILLRMTIIRLVETKRLSSWWSCVTMSVLRRLSVPFAPIEAVSGYIFLIPYLEINAAS